MGTEVLRPTNVFAKRLRTPQATSFRLRLNSPANENLALVVSQKPDNNNKTSPRSNKKKPPVAKKSKNAAQPRLKDDVTNRGFVNGQVTLLRRGESLASIASKKGGNPNPKAISVKSEPVDDLMVCDAGRIGPESPEMVPKQILLPPPDMFAGPSVNLSPSPRAVPLPSFFSRKQQNEDDSNSATRDIRRLLRLD